jgi:hypothetical protein
MKQRRQVNYIRSHSNDTAARVLKGVLYVGAFLSLSYFTLDHMFLQQEDQTLRQRFGPEVRVERVETAYERGTPVLPRQEENKGCYIDTLVDTLRR